MSYFPDCRAEGLYNEKNLKGDRKKIIDGYDIASEEIDCLFDNLEVYPDVEEILDPNKAVLNLDKVKMVREAVANWLEMKRNEMITAFIDSQTAEEFCGGQQNGGA